MLAAVLIATDLLFTAYHIHCQPLRPEGLKPQKFTAQELNYFTDIPQNIIFDSLQTQDGKLQKCRCDDPSKWKLLTCDVSYDEEMR